MDKLFSMKIASLTNDRLHGISGYGKTLWFARLPEKRKVFKHYPSLGQCFGISRRRTLNPKTLKSKTLIPKTIEP